MLQYGLQNGNLSEDHATDPHNSYAIAKDSLRRLITSRYTKYSLQWVWARIFYPFGCGQNPRCLYPSLINSITNGEEFFVIGSGHYIRDFVHVQDVAHNLLLLATHKDVWDL